MFKKKEYIGIVLDGQSLKVAGASAAGDTFLLKRFETLELDSSVEESGGRGGRKDAGTQARTESGANDIFGIEEESSEGVEELAGELDELIIEEDIHVDMTDEAGRGDTNELILHRYLSSIDQRKKYVASNILTGQTVFHSFQNGNFSDWRHSKLEERVKERLEDTYGYSLSRDLYRYNVQEDGSLSVAVIDKEPAMLQMLLNVSEFTSSNVEICGILPDEIALSGLYKQNYSPGDDSITALIQTGERQCGILFLKGGMILKTLPLIREGRTHKNFLNTIYSKILYQLDSGGIPGLDRIVLADNETGERAVRFFKQNFPDSVVENFELDRTKFDYPDEYSEEIRKYTTAIAVAVLAAGAKKDPDRLFRNLSFLTAYVQDKQKIFKLEWHGVALLIAIGLSPVIFNHLYQQNRAEILSLQSDQLLYEQLITEIQPSVQETERIAAELEDRNAQVELMQEISQRELFWTGHLGRLNHSIDETGSLWLTSLRQADVGFTVEGYSLYQNRITTLSREFDGVILRNVRIGQIREADLYHFTMFIPVQPEP